jgi:hypothetical protein
MGKKKFYPSHWKRRVVFVVVKKSGQPRLGFVHKQKRYEDACVPKPERLSMSCSFDDPVTLCHGIVTSLRYTPICQLLLLSRLDDYSMDVDGGPTLHCSCAPALPNTDLCFPVQQDSTFTT